MSKFTLNLRYSTEDIQGYDPHEWSCVQSVESVEEALFLAVRYTEGGAGPLTSVDVEIISNEDDLVVVSLPGLFPDNVFEARERYEERQAAFAALLKPSEDENTDDVVIDDDDLPF